MTNQKRKIESDDLKKLYQQELEELNMPYTDEEIEIHIYHREWKSIMEMIHAHNWQLIMLCLAWTDYLEGKQPRPKKKICKYVNPSQSADINNACYMIRELIRMMCTYGEGNCPHARINTYCSRSTATLIERLGNIQHSKHLTRAECAAAKIFKYATYQGEPTMSPKDFHDTLYALAKTFVDECTANAEELADFTEKAVAKIEGREMARIFASNNKPISRDEAQQMLEGQTSDIKSAIVTDGQATRKEVKSDAKAIALKQDVALASLSEISTTTKRIDNREHNYYHDGKKNYTNEMLEAIHNTWITISNNEEFKNSLNTKGSHKAAFERGKHLFEPFGIDDVRELDRALHIRSQRLSRKRSAQHAKRMNAKSSHK